MSFSVGRRKEEKKKRKEKAKGKKVENQRQQGSLKLSIIVINRQKHECKSCFLSLVCLSSHRHISHSESL